MTRFATGATGKLCVSAHAISMRQGGSGTRGTGAAGGRRAHVERERAVRPLGRVARVANTPNAWHHSSFRYRICDNTVRGGDLFRFGERFLFFGVGERRRGGEERRVGARMCRVLYIVAASRTVSGSSV